MKWAGFEARTTSFKKISIFLPPPTLKPLLAHMVSLCLLIKKKKKMPSRGRQNPTGTQPGKRIKHLCVRKRHFCFWVDATLSQVTQLGDQSTGLIFTFFSHPESDTLVSSTICATEYHGRF